MTFEPTEPEPLSVAEKRWRRMLTDASKRAVPCTITVEDITELLATEKCTTCDIKLTASSPFALATEPSIMRVVEAVGYVKENLRVRCLKCSEMPSAKKLAKATVAREAKALDKQHKRSLEGQVRSEERRAQEREQQEAKRVADAMKEVGAKAELRLSTIKARAAKKGHACTLTVEDVALLLVVPVCPVCGVKMTLARASAPSYVTVDRSRHLEGYVPGNVTAMCLACNQRKGEFERRHIALRREGRERDRVREHVEKLKARAR